MSLSIIREWQIPQTPPFSNSNLPSNRHYLCPFLALPLVRSNPALTMGDSEDQYTVVEEGGEAISVTLESGVVVTLDESHASEYSLHG